MNGIMAPCLTPRNERFAGKNCQGSMILALWEQTSARLPFGHREKYCHNGALAFALSLRGKGTKMAPFAPTSVPSRSENPCKAAKILLRVRGSSSFGAGMG
jgi:hypothetical protein